MTPTLLMIIGGIALAVSMIAGGIVFFAFAKNMKKNSFESGSKLVGLYGLCGALVSISGLVLTGGFIWFLVEKFSQ